MKRNYKSYRYRRKKKNRTLLWIAVGAAVLLAVVGAVWAAVFFMHREEEEGPEELLQAYMAHIPNQEYEAMYRMIEPEASGNISQEDFIKRNSAIYEGIEMQNMEIEILEYDKEREAVSYATSFDTAAGAVSFENEAVFQKGEDGYRLVWQDYLIFPELGASDKVRVSTTKAERGQISDRNGRMLAGKGTASSVGLVPGRFEDREKEIQELAEILGMEPENIEKKLEAQWVKDDSFVPVKTIPKLKETDLFAENPDEETIKAVERQEKLQAIPGVMITDTEVREYPLGEAAAHLVGYVQNVTAEDLEEHAGEGYTADSVIGRSGLEGLYEKELKGQDGCRIYIVDSEGNEKKQLAVVPVRHGQEIRVTIDSDLQRSVYEQLKEDQSCSVAMNPFTGEVLALVSTPSYDNNDFILGLSTEKWNALNEDEGQPMYNRFRQGWCPGSTFKPVTAAVGLETGDIDPAEDYGSEGLSWQKDSSWGSYFVTTLRLFEPVTLENALIYSDNIYFAKAALKIGADKLGAGLAKLGFGQELPFELRMQTSQYSNTDKIETEIQLADSGYGQGQILINPLHMASIYSAFCNEGNMVKPYLLDQPEAKTQYWIPEAMSKETAAKVLDGITKAVNDPKSGGYAAHREDVVLAGKTGTAELKESQDQTWGMELGWFMILTAEKTTERPILMVTMVEDVKGRGSSGYVVDKTAAVLEEWFGKDENF